MSFNGKSMRKINTFFTLTFFSICTYASGDFVNLVQILSNTNYFQNEETYKKFETNYKDIIDQKIKLLNINAQEQGSNDTILHRILKSKITAFFHCFTSYNLNLIHSFEIETFCFALSK